MLFLVHFLLAASHLHLALGSLSGAGGQSPININTRSAASVFASDGTLQAIYQRSVRAEIFSGGSPPFRKLEVEFSKNAGTLLVDSVPLELQNFHIHIPSEHLLNGERFPMEVHLVHKDSKNAAVVGLFYTFGPTKDPFITQIEPYLPSLAVEDGIEVISSIDPSLLNVPRADFLRYNGSLTTPDFNEGITWNVVREARSITQDQFVLLAAVLKGPNARATQPLNGRTVRHYVDRLIETL